MQAQLDMKIQMAHQFLQRGQVEQAETLIRQVLAQEPENTNAMSALAVIYTKQQKYQLAIEILDNTYKNNPNSLDTLIRMATIYKNWGKFNEAKACYRRAISLDPSSAPQFYLAIATTSKYSEYDADVASMEKSYQDTADNSTSRRYLDFALGKVFDDLKEYEKAFLHFEEGNRIAAAINPFSPEAMEYTYQQIKNLMNREYFNHHQDAGITDDTPIFITGMPRSGTTLVEQILASHPDVHGGGELDKISSIANGISHKQGSLFPAGFDTLDQKELKSKANQFVTELAALAGEKKHTTDKSISNYVYMGLIKVMMPNSKIILCKRDPRDIGLSVFQLDLGHTYPWTYQLDWIGKFYRLFEDLTDHWIQCLPGQIHSVQYEDMVSNPEHHIRALLDYCGLDFDPACLEFHKMDRMVTTSSRAQVRKPIYKGSAGRWKNYEKHLGPMISALGMNEPRSPAI